MENYRSTKVKYMTLLALAATAAQAAAGTITVQNQSSITVPESRVYKTCVGAFAAQVFGSLDPGMAQTQVRTSPVQGGCVWAREVGVDPQQPTCHAFTGTSEPAQITVTWFGDSADTLGCAIAVNQAPASDPLAPPSGLAASLAQSNGGPAVVELSWSDNSSGEQSFELQRRTDSAIFVTVASLAPDTVSFVDGFADPGHTYTYRVRACGSGGCSAFSNEASITVSP